MRSYEISKRIEKAVFEAVQLMKDRKVDKNKAAEEIALKHKIKPSTIKNIIFEKALTRGDYFRDK